MSRIKELKLNPENNLNMVDVFQMIAPEGKTKYIELIIKMSKNTKNLDRYVEEIKEHLTKELSLTKEAMEQFTPFQLFTAYKFLTQSFEFSDLRMFQKFCEYNERGLITDNDLTKYRDFEDIMTATSIAELKANEKDLEKQIRVLYSDDEWVVLRPLTYHSSLKYGSSTKWCTASEDNPDYFKRYTTRGILIYVVNKVTGLKVGAFKSLDSDPEFSFWNQVDTRVDSIESGLPQMILDVIRKEVTENPVTNNSYLSDEDKKREDHMMRLKTQKRIISDSREEPDEPLMEMTQENEMAMTERAIPQGRVMEEAVDEVYNSDMMSEAMNEAPQQEMGMGGENRRIY